MKIISKGHSFYHINQEAGQAPKKPKGDDIARATITINSNTRHINRKTKKGLLKQVNFSIDISELYLKGDKFQDGNLRKNISCLGKHYIRYIHFEYCTSSSKAAFYRRHTY